MIGKLVAGTLLSLSLLSWAQAQTYVRPYVRQDGTFVRGHYRSDPDGDFYNNWSTYPNVNPYTLRRGTRHYPSNRGSYYTPYGAHRYDGTYVVPRGLLPQSDSGGAPPWDISAYMQRRERQQLENDLMRTQLEYRRQVLKWQEQEQQRTNNGGYKPSYSFPAYGPGHLD
jgi:hypothetical protein